MLNFGRIIWHTELHLRGTNHPPILYTFPHHFSIVMTRTFSPAINIETRQIEWAMYRGGAYVGVSSAVEIAAHFREKYKQPYEDWRKAHI